METKSRYQVMLEMEDTKRDLIQQKEQLNKVLENDRQKLKRMKRDLEDATEQVDDYEKSLPDKIAVIDELIASVDDGLKRFNPQL